MKFLLLLLALSTLFVDHLARNVICENEGCYEVIKSFAELLEKKINETDAILAEAENELSKITFGNDENFAAAIKAVDGKLTELIKEFYVGVDGGERNLLQLVNAVFEDAKKAENLVKDVETAADGAAKNAEAAKSNMDNTQEIIRELQDKINKLLNATEIDAPKALQDAFDRSDKVNNESSELKVILDQVKHILRDYESNLLNAKRLTAQAIEKFVKVTQTADDTVKEQKAIGDDLSGIGNMKQSEQELINMRKLTGEAVDQVNNVFDEAFNLLDEINALELTVKLDDINKKVEQLKEYSELSLQQFAEDNEKFLSEMIKTFEAAKTIEERALKLQGDLDESLKAINEIRSDALKAIADKDAIIFAAQMIRSSLEDFTLNVENSRENARTALEKIPEILKMIRDSEDIVEKLENKLDASSKAANDAKDLCVTAKEQMDEILQDSDSIKAQIKQLEKDFENLPDELKLADDESLSISDEVDKLESSEADDSELIESTKEKVGNADVLTEKTGEAVDDALKKIQSLVDDISKRKDIDLSTLDDFEAKLIEAEKELDESHLDENLRKLRAERHGQNALVEQFQLQIAALEYQLSVIKKNAESLENRCFRRTRLEP